MSSAATPAELNTMARRVIDRDHHMTLGTSGGSARRRLGPLPVR